MENINYALPEAQKEFLNIIQKLDHKSIKLLTSWISQNWTSDNESTSSLPDNILLTISQNIREEMPLEGILPSENDTMKGIKMEKDTAHVDYFLYDDDLIDELCENGLISRNYCSECGSHKTKPINFISHSASRNRLNFIFNALLPPLEDKVILDIGSRLGAVLYGAQVYTKNCQIIGIEINSELCELQRKIVKKFKFEKNIKVIEGDIKKREDLIQSANVIILNNVFEYFLDKESQNSMWKYLRDNIQKKTLVVTIPALDETLASLQMDIDLENWVKEIEPYNIEAPGIDQLDIELKEVKLYEIL